MFSTEINEMTFAKIRAYDRAVITSADDDWKTYNDIRNKYLCQDFEKCQCD
jgi:hypothetical protein